MTSTNTSTETHTPQLNAGWETNPSRTGGYTLRAVVLTAFTTVAMYNSVELLVLIFTTFKSYSSLYFWSILVASIGVLPYAIGELTEFYQLGPIWMSNLLDCVGWIMMITGQSVLLYSRLHLVLRSKKILKAVKWMIILNAVTIDTLGIVFDFMYIYNKPGPSIVNTYGDFTRYQMTMFCVQELILSGLYIWTMAKMLKEGAKAQHRRMFIQMLVINIIIIFMDIAVLVIEYINLYDLMLALKCFIYSVKLKLEFAILGKLVDVAHTHVRGMSTSEDLETSGERLRGTSRRDRDGSVMIDPLSPEPSTATAQRLSVDMTIGASQSNSAVVSLDPRWNEKPATSDRTSEEETYEDVIRQIATPRPSITLASPREGISRHRASIA